MKVMSFFYRNPVFTYQEYFDFLDSAGTHNKATKDSLLKYHVHKGHLVRLRRGLFASVPPGQNSKDLSVDPYLLMSKLASDSVAAYHSALEFHGLAQSHHFFHYYLTQEKKTEFHFQSYQFVPVKVPAVLLKVNAEQFGVENAGRLTENIRVTTLERTLVDVLARPDKASGWEEIWRSLAAAEYLNVAKVVDYTLMLASGTTTAKVGFFLEQNKERWAVDKVQLQRLEIHAPKQVRYLERRKRTKGRLVKPWNLVVPEQVFDRSWEEPWEKIKMEDAY